MKNGLITYDDLKQLPEKIMVDLIDGVIYELESPGVQHQDLANFLAMEIYDYARKNSWKLLIRPFDVEVDGSEYTVIQPDLLLFCDRNKLTMEKGIGSPFSATLDYVIKLKKYMESGVREYWIVDPIRDIVRKYRLKTNGFNYEAYDLTSRVNSEVCPDLWIDFGVWKRMYEEWTKGTEQTAEQNQVDSQ